MRRLRVLLCAAAVLACAVVLVACGGSGADDSSASTSESASLSGFTAEEQAVYEQAKNGDGIVNTFIGDKFCDHKVTDEESAKACILEVIDRIGGDETTELVLDNVFPNEDGMTVVSFTQRAGDILVYGANVKLVLDKDDQPIALNSSIMPNVRIRDTDEWAVDAERAEQIVAEQMKDGDLEGMVVEGATQKVIISEPDKKESFTCAWVVYTEQSAAETDTDAESDIHNQDCTAHYVRASGEYLYSMPVSSPEDPDAAIGQSAKNKFDFGAYVSDEMGVTIELSDGTTKEVTVPVLKDTETGKTYLADAKRKIVCADQGSYLYGDKFVPTEVQDGYDPIDAHEYYTFIRAWDFYDSIGWTGPDGAGTPTLLLMNYVSPSGTPVDNAAYLTKRDGFQIFTFTRACDYGKCLDVVAHEFTHCFTGTSMKFSLYQNDIGAISEGLSDIMGNIVEMRLEGDDGAWTISEGLGEDKIARSLADPHAYARPEFAFDTYYAPRPSTVTKMNDTGGVHINSTLLGLVSYKLYQAGMGPKDQGYFWLNAALVMSPQNDYPMLAQILPWVMQQLGYDQYVEALKQAIEEGKFTVTEDPGTVADGYGTASLDLSSAEGAVNDGLVCVAFFRAPDANPGKRVNTWPAAGTTVAKAHMPAGDYYVAISMGSYDGNLRRYLVLAEDGWVELGDASIGDVGTAITVEDDKIAEVSTEGLGPAAAEQLQMIEQALAAMAED